MQLFKAVKKGAVLANPVCVTIRIVAAEGIVMEYRSWVTLVSGLISSILSLDKTTGCELRDAVW